MAGEDKDWLSPKSIEEMAKGLKAMANNFKDIDKSTAKTSSTVNKIYAKTSKVFKDLQLDAIDREVAKIQAKVFATAKTLHESAGSTLKQFRELNQNLIKSTKILNQATAQGVFNSADLLEAANKLASIGWSDLSSLQDIVPAMASIEKSVGVLTTTFSKSVMSMQRVFKEGTTNLVKSLGDSFTAFSKLQGVTAEQLQNAVSTLDSNIQVMAKGSAEMYAQLSNNLSAGISLASQMNVSSDKMSNLLNSIMDASGKELESYAQAFSQSGLNIYEVQQRLLRGDFASVTEDLLRGIGDTLQRGDRVTANQLKDLMGGLSFSDAELNYITANIGNMEEYLANISEASNNSGAMNERLSSSIMSLRDRVSNMFSSSSLANSLSGTLTSLGIGSFSEGLTAFSSATKVLDTLKGIKVPGGFAGGEAVTNTLGGLLSGGEGLGGIIKSLGPALGKISMWAAIIAVALEVLGKVLEDEKVQDSLNQIMNFIGKIFDVVQQVFDLVVNNIAEIVTDIVNMVLPVVVSVLDALMPVLNLLSEAVIPILNESLGNLISMIEVSMEPLKSILELFTSSLSMLVTIADPIFKMLIAMMKGILSPLIEMSNKVFTKIARTFNFITPIVNFLTKVLAGISDAVRSLVNKLADFTIFGIQPFAFLKTGENTEAPAGVMQEISNSTTQTTFNTTAGGMSYGFGLAGNGFHVGQDIPMASGTPLRASDVGLVTGTGFNRTYGNFVSMLGSDGIQRVLGHLNSVGVSRGDTVLPGDSLGTSGSTGDSRLPHVHYETRANGRFVDPFIVNNRSSNADVVKAIEIMTVRLENKLEEVSQETEANSKWIEEFDRKARSKTLTAY